MTGSGALGRGAAGVGDDPEVHLGVVRVRSTVDGAVPVFRAPPPVALEVLLPSPIGVRFAPGRPPGSAAAHFGGGVHGMPLAAWRAVVAAVLVAAAVGARPAEAANNGTNVLFIIVDDLNDWVTHLKGEAGGGPPATTPAFTPNIDALAASGVTFTRAYAPAPVCNPSRAALLGGRRPGFTGIYDNNHDWKSAFGSRNIVPLTKHFKANGYNVMGMGKIYHPMNSPVAAYSNGQLFTSYTAGSGGGGGTLNLSGLDLGTFDYGTPSSADTDSEMLDYNVATTAIAKINQAHTSRSSSRSDSRSRMFRGTYLRRTSTRSRSTTTCGRPRSRTIWGTYRPPGMPWPTALASTTRRRTFTRWSIRPRTTGGTRRSGVIWRPSSSWTGRSGGCWPR